MSSRRRLAAAVAAPLLLAGCGLPIGVQIASLFADGVSILTTDKTITDHGISAVTQKDCALWRGVEGEDICKASDDVGTALADAGDPPEAIDQSPEEIRGGTAETGSQKNNKIDTAQEGTPEFPQEGPVEAASAPPSSPSAAPAPAVRKVSGEPLQPASVISEPLASPKPWQAVAILKEEIPEAPAAKPEAPAESPPVAEPRKPKPAASVKPRRQPAGERRTYYVIASYSRAADAARFSRRHATLDAAVLKGTAKGRKVFRVVVGPVARDQRRKTKSRLQRNGFRDTWKLTLRRPEVITEVAQLR